MYQGMAEGDTVAKIIEVMGSSTIKETFDALEQDQRIAGIRLRTFGTVVTPIIENSTEKVRGYVVWWHMEGMASVTLTEGEDEVLIGMYCEPERTPTQGEALELFNLSMQDQDEIKALRTDGDSVA